ncbi:FKBP-type peptidyl-prolyl cis-trans isomerase [Cellulomonas sp. ATA003]|uniref:FKBP-type peptidyl-prolyl cis-trans isomerase n=1 Tax=Cellulomonas sp. ATA003 TaxID=3073064 RepID=UPI002873E82B|nr:FKBP-type peptidyl-prolyl cis-trans isomerase [Cellulomonas sp. ATA003]WNB86851.1 FKBP-type peptidyl-prolyl cis-trans isomerase [Cellulomonas sp. ATA003]
MLVAVLATALLVGCSPRSEPAPEVDVTGGAGEEPSLEYTPPLTISEATSEVLWEGTGPELEDSGPVLLDYRLQRADDGSLVEETYSTVPKPFTLTPEVLSADLHEALDGRTVGSRLLLLLPATSDTSSFASVMVVDVRPTRAWGEPVEPREGLPAVTLAEDGEPLIETPQGDPPRSLVVQALLRGDGDQVVEGSTVTVQYTGVRWSDGSMYDSSWVQGGPESFDLGSGVLPGLAEGLLEQTVGSQVMLVIPPESGGAVGGEEDTLVLVVDILATSAPAPDALTEEG